MKMVHLQPKNIKTNFQAYRKVVNNFHHPDCNLSIFFVKYILEYFQRQSMNHLHKPSTYNSPSRLARSLMVQGFCSTPEGTIELLAQLGFQYLVGIARNR